MNNVKVDSGCCALLAVQTTLKGLGSMKTCNVINQLCRAGSNANDVRFMAIENKSDAYMVIKAEKPVGTIEVSPDIKKAALVLFYQYLRANSPSVTCCQCSSNSCPKKILFWGNDKK